MNKIQEQLPELWEKLNPDGRFDAYFARRDELMSAIAQLPPEERWRRMQDFSESKEAKAYVNHQAKVLQEFLLQKRLDIVLGFTRLMQENSQTMSALFPMSAAPPVSYAKEIAGSVNQSIGLYCDALPKSFLQKVRLLFDASVTADENGLWHDSQPVIEMTFDFGIHTIHPSLLWDAPLELERDGRNNAELWADETWPEFRKNASPEEIVRTAEQVRELEAKEYPEVTVEHEVVF